MDTTILYVKITFAEMSYHYILYYYVCVMHICNVFLEDCKNMSLWVRMHNQH